MAARYYASCLHPTTALLSGWLNHICKKLEMEMQHQHLENNQVFKLHLEIQILTMVRRNRKLQSAIIFRIRVACHCAHAAILKTEHWCNNLNFQIILDQTKHSTIQTETINKIKWNEKSRRLDSRVGRLKKKRTALWVPLQFPSRERNAGWW